MIEWTYTFLGEGITKKKRTGPPAHRGSRDEWFQYARALEKELITLRESTKKLEPRSTEEEVKDLYHGQATMVVPIGSFRLLEDRLAETLGRLNKLETRIQKLENRWAKIWGEA